MGAKNKVIAGDYEGHLISQTLGTVFIFIGLSKKIQITKEIIESYELITDEHQKSAASGIARGLIGGALLGPVGLLAGSMSAKNKGIYTVALLFKDGKKSLAEVDDKTYKTLTKVLF